MRRNNYFLTSMRKGLALAALTLASSAMAQNHYFEGYWAPAKPKDGESSQMLKLNGPAKAAFPVNTSYTTDDEGNEIMGYCQDPTHRDPNFYDVQGCVNGQAIQVTFANMGFKPQIWTGNSSREGFTIEVTPGFVGGRYVSLTYDVTNNNPEATFAKFSIGADTQIKDNDHSTNTKNEDLNVIKMKDDESGISFAAQFLPKMDCHLRVVYFGDASSVYNGTEPNDASLPDRTGQTDFDSGFCTWWSYTWQPGETKTYKTMVCVGDETTLQQFIDEIALKDIATNEVLNANEYYLGLNHKPKNKKENTVIGLKSMKAMAVEKDADGNPQFKITYEKSGCDNDTIIPFSTLYGICTGSGSNLDGTGVPTSVNAIGSDANVLTIKEGETTYNYLIGADGPVVTKKEGTNYEFVVKSGTAADAVTYGTIDFSKAGKFSFGTAEGTDVFDLEVVGTDNKIVYGGEDAYVTPEVTANPNFYGANGDPKVIYKRVVSEGVYEAVADNQPVGAGTYAVFAYTDNIGSETEPLYVGEFIIEKRDVKKDDDITKDYLEVPAEIKRFLLKADNTAKVQLSAAPEGTEYDANAVTGEVIEPIEGGETAADYFSYSFDADNNLVVKCLKRGLKKDNKTLKVTIPVDESDNFNAYTIEVEIPICVGPDTEKEYYDDADIREAEPGEILDATEWIINDLDPVAGDELKKVATDEETEKGLWVWLETTATGDIEEVGKQENAEALNKFAEANGYNIAAYVEINAFKEVPGEDKEELTEVFDPVTITLSIPDSLLDLEDDSIYQIRQFYMNVIDADGNLSAVWPKKVNKDERTITFAADKFSTYTLCWSNGEPFKATQNRADANIRFTGNKVIFANDFIISMGGHNKSVSGQWKKKVIIKEKGKEDRIEWQKVADVSSNICAMQEFEFAYADYNLTDGEYELALPMGFFVYLSEGEEGSYDFEDTNEINQDNGGVITKKAKAAIRRAAAGQKAIPVQGIKLGVVIGNGIVTSITVEAEDNDAADAVAIDINGRAVNAADAKGVIIVNGQKILKK